MNPLLSAVRVTHRHLIQRRRFRVLAQMLSAHIPPGASVLDIGCGPGIVGRLIQEENPSISIHGLEVMARPHCAIEFDLFDGRTIPLPDEAVDVCLFVDVLHHTTDPERLLSEAFRVSRRYVLMKDHLCENGLDRAVLSFMDWVGNRPHRVFMPCNFKSKGAWDGFFTAAEARVLSWETKIPLYPFPLDQVFGRKLHFIALLEKQAVTASVAAPVSADLPAVGPAAISVNPAGNVLPGGVRGAISARRWMRRERPSSG
jgi:SAM-dependent methyltransferase